MDTERFEAARSGVYPRAAGSIGTYSEKALHECIKLYFEPDAAFHEARLGPFSADILNSRGVTEIQTGNFGRLLKKLSRFLADYPVTVVYPAARDKYLQWIDPETGEISGRRKSPKRGSVCSVLPELYAIKPLLSHENLKICVLLLDMDEFRLQNGWGRDGKRGSVRYERFPLALQDELWLSAPEDFGRLLPPELPEAFTFAEFSRASGLSGRAAWGGLDVLRSVGAAPRCGSKGRAYVYRRAFGGG